LIKSVLSPLYIGGGTWKNSDLSPYIKGVEPRKIANFLLKAPGHGKISSSFSIIMRALGSRETKRSAYHHSKLSSYI